jgi:hypothetical protein
MKTFIYGNEEKQGRWAVCAAVRQLAVRRPKDKKLKRPRTGRLRVDEGSQRSGRRIEPRLAADSNNSEKAKAEKIELLPGIKSGRRDR